MSSAAEPEARLDGDGWLRCEAGHRHWGRHGASGLLVRCNDADGVPHVLLQRRAWWTHHGGTWGVPGGACASWETPAEAALRETGEEVVIELDRITVAGMHHDDHGGWSYWTVFATAESLLEAGPRNRESDELRWVAESDVEALPLHPGFAATWPQLR